MKYKNILFWIVLFLTSFQSFGQDAIFTQFYNAPLYLNPAFAGSTSQARLVANYRRQWSGFDASFNTGTFSYDQYVEKYKMGFGVMFKNDQIQSSGATAIQTNDASGFYSYRFQINKKLVMQAGVQGTFVSRSLSYNDLLFGDQITADGVLNLPTAESNLNTMRNFADFSAGTVLYSQNWFGGLSVHHFNQPNESFSGFVSKLPMKTSIFGGYLISLIDERTRRPADKPIEQRSIVPTFLYQKQGNSQQLTAGVYINYSPIYTGIFYRGLPNGKSYQSLISQDGFAFLFGSMLSNGLNIAYSFDATTSKLGIKTGGSHEISLIYNFQVNHTYGSAPDNGFPLAKCPSMKRRYQKIR